MSHEILEVRKVIRAVCFEHCIESELPSDKNQAKKVVLALKRFSDEQKLMGHDYHKLSEDKENKKAKALIKKFSQPLYSIDVGNRGGSLGNYRLLFYRDPTYSEIAKIVTIFLDDH